MTKLRAAVLAVLSFGFNAYVILNAFAVSNAFAVQDVTCWNGDCLKNGWTRTSLVDQTFTDYQCYRDGCNLSGWITGGTQGVEHYTQCQSGGCFVSGWYTLDRTAQTLISQTRCNGKVDGGASASGAVGGNRNIISNGNSSGDGDCMKNGWTTYDSYGSVRTLCLENDCAKVGWTSVSPSGKAASAYCKNGGCFQAGWIEAN
jgi:hypothetical protein